MGAKRSVGPKKKEKMDGPVGVVVAAMAPLERPGSQNELISVAGGSGRILGGGVVDNPGAGFVMISDFPGYCPMNEVNYAKYLASRIDYLQAALDDLRGSFRSEFGSEFGEVSEGTR